MSKTKQHECTPQACTYDHEVEAKGWRGPEVVFGLAYDLITTGDKLLDIGIGTGLGSRPFHKAGLRVFGMDISPEMLAACRAKKCEEDLRQHDLLNAPYHTEICRIYCMPYAGAGPCGAGHGLRCQAR